MLKLWRWKNLSFKNCFGQQKKSKRTQTRAAARGTIKKRTPPRATARGHRARWRAFLCHILVTRTRHMRHMRCICGICRCICRIWGAYAAYEVHMLRTRCICRVRGIRGWKKTLSYPKTVQYIQILQKIEIFSILGKFCRNFCRCPFLPFFQKHFQWLKSIVFGPLCP